MTNDSLTEPTPDAPQTRSAVTAKSAPPDPARRRTTVRMRQLDAQFLIGSMGVFAFLAVGLYFWHGYQVRRQADAILQRAQALYAKEDWKGAASAFHRYLQVRPNDQEVIVARARAFDKMAPGADQRAQVVSLYFRAVRAHPSRTDLRLRLAELLYGTDRFSEAVDQARLILEQEPNDLGAARLLVQALREQVGPAQRVSVVDVIETYEHHLARHPGDVELSIGLAGLLRKHRDILPSKIRDTALTTADTVVDRMIKQHSDDTEAVLARYRYRVANRIAGAEQDLETAQKLAPDNPEVLLNSALAAADAGLEGAKAHGDRMMHVAPDDRRGYLTMAAIQSKWNRPADGVVTLQEGLKQVGEGDLDLNRAILQLCVATRDIAGAKGALARIQPAYRRVAHSMPVPASRRLSEEIEVALAQVQLFEGKSGTALQTLKRMAANVTQSEDPVETLNERQRRWRLLAAAYADQGLHDLSAGAFEELVRLDPLSTEYRIQAGSAWRRSGDVERAIKHFEAASVGDVKSAPAWIGLIDARLDQQFRRVNPETRDWGGLEVVFQKARANVGDLPLFRLLHATMSIAREERRVALEELRPLLSDETLEREYLARVSVLLEDCGEGTSADAALERYRFAGALANDVLMVKSELLRRRGQTAAAIEALQRALEDASAESRAVVVRRLVGLEVDAGSMQAARARLRELRVDQSSDLWVYETAADLAILAGDRGDLEECEHELEALEGQNGSLWRYLHAIRLLENPGNVEENAALAGRYLRDIEGTRPGWPNARLLRGRIAERMGRIAEAAENYELALRSGARNVTTFQWLVATLYRQNRYADAAAYIREVGQIAVLSPDVSVVAIPANLRAGRIEDALRLARAASELRPRDPLAQVWYGQTLALANKSRDAENSLQRAVTLAPKDARTWSALVWLYSREHRESEARKALTELVTQVEMTPLEKDLTLARGSEMIGDRAAAEKHFRLALAAQKKNVRLLEEVGRFFFRYDQKKALEIYHQALEIDPTSSESRRAIALIWGLNGTNAEWDRALALLGSGHQGIETDDRRLEAGLLLIRGGERNRQRAVELIQELIGAQSRPAPADRLLLARAYEDLDQLDAAQEQYDTVLKSHQDPTFIAAFATFLIKHDRLEAAGEWLTRLETQDPAGQRTLELRVEWLERSDRTHEIEPLIESALAARKEAAQTDGQKAEVLLTAANLVSRAKLFDAAEKNLRGAMELAPERYDELAVWLAKRGRTAEALSLSVAKVTELNSVAQTTVLIRVLTVATCRSAEDLEEKLESADKVLADALRGTPEDLPLLMGLGVLRVMQGRDAEMISLYEKALTRDPTNIVVLNNLALVLADIPDRRAEALKYIEQAMVASPNSFELLDTRAMVLLASGRIEDGRRILERLCDKNPRYRLHLAIALHQANESVESQKHVERAMQEGLQDELLTPNERRLMVRIMGKTAGGVDVGSTQ